MWVSGYINSHARIKKIMFLYIYIHINLLNSLYLNFKISSLGVLSKMNLQKIFATCCTLINKVEILNNSTLREFALKRGTTFL